MQDFEKGQLIDWAAQDVRATFFVAAVSVRIDDLYDLIFENRPQNYQDAQFPGGAAMASGLGELGQLVLTRGPGRIDLSLSPAPSPSFISPPGTPLGQIQHALVHDVSGAVARVIRAAHRASSVLTDINRIAFSVSLCTPAPTVSEANAFLNKILPYSIVLKDETEFSLQANYKYLIDSPKVEINSFSTWVVTPVQQINIIAGGGGFNTTAPVEVISAYYLAQKIIDINTMPRREIYTADEAKTVADALVSRLRTLMTIS